LSARLSPCFPRPCRSCRRSSRVERGRRAVPARDADTHARLPHALPGSASWRHGLCLRPLLTLALLPGPCARACRGGAARRERRRLEAEAARKAQEERGVRRGRRQKPVPASSPSRKRVRQPSVSVGVSRRNGSTAALYSRTSSTTTARSRKTGDSRADHRVPQQGSQGEAMPASMKSGKLRCLLELLH